MPKTYETYLLRGFAGRAPRVSQGNLDFVCGRVCATKHALRDPFCLLERRHGLAEIVERGIIVLVERDSEIQFHL